MYKNSLIKKIGLIAKRMTPQAGEKTIAIHVLPNICRSKGNQSLKFGQLIQFNMRNIFLEKPYSKYRGETIPRPFSTKIKIELISGSIV